MESGTVRGRNRDCLVVCQKKKHCTKFANFHCVKCVRPIKLSCYEDIYVFCPTWWDNILDFISTPSSQEKLLPLTYRSSNYLIFQYTVDCAVTNKK